MSSGSCRLCRAYCDWVVDPLGCLDASCPNLYAFDDRSGRRVVGCLERVYEAQLDLASIEELRDGTAALRALRRPLPICRAHAERTYPRRLPAVGCVNPEFAEPTDRPAFRVIVHPARDPGGDEQG